MTLLVKAAIALFFAALASGEPGGTVVVANRGAGTITAIDVATDSTRTFPLPAAAKPSEPMYVVFSGTTGRVFVGDRANNRVVAFRAGDLSPEREIPVGAGVFHMWESTCCRQLWVVGDVDKTITIIDSVALSVVATIPIPADLAAAGGRPHDIFAAPAEPYVYISVLGLPSPSDYVVKYRATDFREAGRQAVGKDPHLWAAAKSSRLFVPCQGSGAVYVLDRTTMALINTVPVAGAHGAAMAGSERACYTTDFTSAAGGNGLFAIDTEQMTVSSVAAVPVSTPHNIVAAGNGRKLYVTHSGANNQVSIYRLNSAGRVPRSLGTVTTGQNPFGLAYVPRTKEDRVQPEHNAVTRWMETALQTVRATGLGTPDAGRLYAMVAVAMYDAVNGIDSAGGSGREHALVPPAGAPRNADRTVAAAAAAHAVLISLAPSQKSALDAALACCGGVSDLAGRNWGEHVGREVVAMRSADGTQSAVILPPGAQPGQHRVSFDARWRFMAPFGIASKNAYASPPPPSLKSSPWAAAFEDVQHAGRQECDSERNDIAQFWLAEEGTVRETGVWMQATLAVARRQGTIRSIADTARLVALAAMAVADSVTVSWETKAAYFTWRPVVAIREADQDGHPDTVADPAWRPRFGMAGGSPEYASGTAAFAAATAQVIERFYDRSRIRFCFETDAAPNGPRCFDSTTEAATEAGRSRIYQGIHFQFSNEEGQRLGTAIGREVVSTRLRHLSSPRGNWVR